MCFWINRYKNLLQTKEHQSFAGFLVVALALARKRVENQQGGPTTEMETQRKQWQSQR